MSSGGPPDFPAYEQIVGAPELRRTVQRLAADVLADLGDEEPLVVVAVMKGALVFLADLVRNLPTPLEIELLNARSYHGTERKRVRILDDVADLELAGRKVLLVDTVLDTGRTLSAVLEALREQAPAALKTCVLLSKRREREVPVTPEYVGMEVPDVFVVGYGLDHHNRWRHLPYVARLPEPAEGEGESRGK